MYFPFFILRHGAKGPPVQPQTIYSEVPKRLTRMAGGLSAFCFFEAGAPPPMKDTASVSQH